MTKKHLSKTPVDDQTFGRLQELGKKVKYIPVGNTRLNGRAGWSISPAILNKFDQVKKTRSIEGLVLTLIWIF